MKKDVPSFILGIAKHHPDWPGRIPIDAITIMSNWLRLHAFISGMKQNRESLSLLGWLLFREYTRKPGPRMDIIVRLHGKLDSMRYEIERVELGTRKPR